jgi:glyoxylase-like metal-dependent hydrolase (beta-lactamase superfamily II)
MQVAGYSISTLVCDTFKLDGGAMFGSVPKVLWSRQIAADSANRIPLACRLLLLEGHSRKVLIDCGVGRKWSEKEGQIYDICHKRSLPEGVTDLVLTHLHFDHGGGVSYRGGEGELRLTYPTATVHIQEANWERALNPGPRERASYLSENILPLKQATRRLCHDGEEILPGIIVHRADGHTLGLQWIVIGDELAFPADLIPTSHHVPLPYIMGYDLHAEKTLEEKTLFLSQAVQKQWTVVFEHDAEVAAARITVDDQGRYSIGERVLVPEL